MYELADLYRRGMHLEAWTAALAVGNLATGTDTGREVDRLASETMRRVRANLEALVEGLFAAGWQFHAEIPLADPTADITTELDEFEDAVGRLPRSLRAFAEHVGQVNLNGHLAGWDILTPDPIVVEITIDRWMSEYQEQVQDRGTEWQHPGPYLVELAPDRFHKADISGGAPYGLAVPNPTADGLLIGEHHQTTFVNYLRITLAHAGMGGIDHPGMASALPGPSGSWPRGCSPSDGEPDPDGHLLPPSSSQ